MSRRVVGYGVLALAAIMAAPSPALGQLFGPAGASTTAEDYRVDLAIPDAPAFELLGGDHGAILRPNTLQELSVAFSQFRGGEGSFQVPGGLAVEFSPALLLSSSDLESTSYQAKKLLYNLRISIATSADSLTDRPSSAAFGLRWTLVNEADMGLDPMFMSDQQVTPITEQMVLVYQAARDRQGPVGEIVLTEDERATIERLADEIRARWADRYWNAESVELALGTRASGLGEGGSAARVDRFGLFATYARGFGDWGQLVLGGRLGAERAVGEDDYSQSIGVGGRFYAGSNRHKAFFEIQQSIEEGEDDDLLINAGAEVRIHDWIWAVGSFGIEDVGEGEEDRGVASFSLKTALPRL